MRDHTSYDRSCFCKQAQVSGRDLWSLHTFAFCGISIRSVSCLAAKHDVRWSDQREHKDTIEQHLRYVHLYLKHVSWLWLATTLLVESDKLLGLHYPSNQPKTEEWWDIGRLRHTLQFYLLRTRGGCSLHTLSIEGIAVSESQSDEAVGAAVLRFTWQRAWQSLDMHASTRGYSSQECLQQSTNEYFLRLWRRSLWQKTYQTSKDRQ